MKEKDKRAHGLRGLTRIFIIVIVFFSCVEQSSAPNIQDIANQWHIIQNNPNTESIDNFYKSIDQFQKSELYRIYNSIPFSSQIEYEPGPHIGRPIHNDIIKQTVDNLQRYILIFRSSVIAGDLETAQAASFEITSSINRLLSIDADAQRYAASSYFNLLMTLAMFIIIIVLLAALLYKALTRSLKREDERTVFSHAYLLAQEEERLRISRELHDTVIQDMRYLLLETEKAGDTTNAGKTVPLIADLIRKTRSVCNDLVPPDFRFSELPDAIKQLCLDISEKTGINCRAEIDENIKLDFLSVEKKLQVFRIIREALTNIEKHAEAKEAIVTMRGDKSPDTTNEVIYIGISDDGKGFVSPLDKSQRSHLGIITMKERAAILGGTLKIITEPGEGALVCLEFPCNSA